MKLTPTIQKSAPKLKLTSILLRTYTLLSSTLLQALNRSTNPDGLDVDELANAKLREFASVAGVLDSTERQSRI